MKEYILCAAIWYDDKKKREHQPKNIKSGIVVCGRRHYNCFVILQETVGDIKRTKENFTQGFLTSSDRFVNRKLAAKVAVDAKQTKENKHILVSEDLY